MKMIRDRVGTTALTAHEVRSVAVALLAESIESSRDSRVSPIKRSGQSSAAASRKWGTRMWLAATATFVFLACLAMAPRAWAQTKSVTGEVAQRVTIEHVRVTTSKPYAEVKAALEAKVNRYDDHVTALIRGGDVEGARKELERIASPTGLMILQTLNHGVALALRGGPKNAMQYGIGNVLTATEMTRYQLAAGLYAPIRVMLYEGQGGGAVIEYDRPSSLFGNLGSKEIDAVAARLDVQLQSVFDDVTR